MKTALNALVFTLGLVALPSMAGISINAGAIKVQPNDSSSSLNVVEKVAGLPTNSTAVEVNDNTQLGLTVDYQLNKNWTLELVAATPFNHDVHVKGSAINGLKVGETKHLPPSLIGQYHFDLGDSKLDPFIGFGVNYTNFFQEKVDNQLVGALTPLLKLTPANQLTLKLKDSWGLALQAGMNYQLSEQWGLHFAVSKMDIDTVADVRLDGTTIQSVDVKIDPMVVMFGVRYSM
jgi:outer membrane protein